jgi:diaminopimelate decarboxylase
MSHRLLELLPAGAEVDADGTLRIAGCRVDDLATEFRHPGDHRR